MSEEYETYYDTKEEVLREAFRRGEPGSLVHLHHSELVFGVPEREHMYTGGECWCQPEVFVVPGRN